MNSRGRGEIIAPRAASKPTRRNGRSADGALRRDIRGLSMKTNVKFPLLSLALLCALAQGTTPPARAQSAKGNPAAPAADAAQPAALPAKPVAGKPAPSGWTHYEIGEPARFSLILPAEPVAKVERVTILPGVAATTQTYLSVSKSVVCGVSYLESLPAAARNEAQKQAIFTRFVKEFAESLQSGMKDRDVTVNLTMLEQRTATVSGLAGYEQDFSYDKVMGRVRLVFDPASAYAVVAVWPGSSSNSEVSAFFESLKVNPKR